MPIARLASIVLALGLSSASAEPVTAPLFGAATNFSQGIQPQSLPLARDLGLSMLRDGMNWRRVERVPGEYNFTGPRHSYPDRIAESGGTVSVVVNWGNPLYDNGQTPQSPEALAAMADFAVALVTRFDAIDAIEIGNEFNGVNFVRGPLEKMKPDERARAYVPMLRAVSEAVRKARPDIRVLGGATHSLPGGWLWEIMDQGGAEFMDAVAVHPYTSPAEQFVRQVAVLRRHPALADMPFEITEFGASPSIDGAGHMLRNYCQFALAGVSHAVWFPANLRGEATQPLFTPEGRITDAGRAYRLISTRMEGRPVVDAAPNAFTYGCQFGDDVLVLWGMPHDVSVPSDVTVLDAEGAKVAGPYRLSDSKPLVFVADAVASRVKVAPTRRVADSFHQFGYPVKDEHQAQGDPFERFARNGDRIIPLQTLPGQERTGVPWFPYRGQPDKKDVRLTAETLLPARNKEIVHRYTAPSDQTVSLSARFTPSNRSKDGIGIKLSLNGSLLSSATTKTAFDLSESAIELRTGDVLELVVDANGTSKGDLTQYHIALDLD